MENAENLFEYFKKNDLDNMEFLDSFGGITSTDKDIEVLKNFSEVIKLRISGLHPLKISKLLGISKSTISKWIYKMNLPMIARILQHSITLSNQEKGKLLSLNLTRGGLLIGPWIYVPNKINNYQDVKEVINQLNPLPESHKRAKEFRINAKSLIKNRELFFAYILGIMIGDAGKYGFQRQHKFMRRIQLKLTKKEKTNERLGQFVDLCINNLGLRYSQCKDVPPSKKNKHYFYSWNSQSSLLINWMFNVCLGLRDGEKTTYAPIRADWILDSPKNFRIWFLQGIADSDGYIDINSFQAGIVSKPNIDFIQKVFDSLYIRSSKGYLHKGSLGVIRINLKDADKLPLFNEYVKLYRYCL